jgi:hypothetical protein
MEANQINALIYFGAVTGAIGTIAAGWLWIRQLVIERTKLFPYITHWITIFGADSYLIIKARVAVENKSRIDNVVRIITIKAREEKDFAFSAIHLSENTTNDRARIEYRDGHLEEICPINQAIVLPLNIVSRHSESGWIGFGISPEFAEKAKKLHWCVKITDMDGKKYTSPESQDQSFTEIRRDIMTSGHDDETPEEKQLKKENERWKDYANALLIAIPVLLAGLALSGMKTGNSIASGFAGLAGIVLVIFWYGRDKTITLLTPLNRYPTFLFYASCCFGVQVGCLAFAFLNR